MKQIELENRTIFNNKFIELHSLKKKFIGMTKFMNDIIYSIHSSVDDVRFKMITINQLSLSIEQYYGTNKF